MTRLGKVALDGTDHSYSVELAKGDAGLYPATKGEFDTTGSIEAGWILLADRSQRGALGTWGSQNAANESGAVDEAQFVAAESTRFVSHLPVIIENVSHLNPNQTAVNLGSVSNVPVQRITNVGSINP